MSGFSRKGTRCLVAASLMLTAGWRSVMAAGPVTVPRAETVLATLDASHPRLILKDSDLTRLKKRLEVDPLLKTCRDALLRRADECCRQPPLTYDLRGPRLLHVSRECLNRLYTLGLAWRLTSDDRYARSARENLLAVSAFKDWNPSHFLDVAEMSHGVGIGYDWFFHQFDEATRSAIRQALIEKGLKPGLAVYAKGGWWTASAFNWNQVCNGGLVVGALAIAETDPDYARQIVPAAVRSLPRALATYGPDGAWPEGPGYWGYATSYTVFGLAALETALGTDFGLSAVKGLSEAGWAPLYLAGPTDLYVNFADSGERSRRSNIPCLLWLARRYRRPAFAEAERAMLARRPGQPLDLIWYVPPSDEPPEPLALDRRFRGPVEVAVFRSAFSDPDALFVSVKAGYNQVNHGHLDLGAFELDALGVRWARDLGSDDYNLPGYWEKGVGGKRWTCYRLNSLSHNVCLLDNGSQDVLGTSAIATFTSEPAFARATVDLTSAYAPLAERAWRGVALLDRRRVLVQDEFTLRKACEVAWGMTTDAAIELEGASAVLSQGGKTLRARVLSPEDAAFSVESAEQKPPEKPNTGVRRLMVRLKDQSGSVRVAVLLTPDWPVTPSPSGAAHAHPGAGVPHSPDLKPLAEW